MDNARDFVDEDHDFFQETFGGLHELADEAETWTGLRG
jgi:hypothetical protein